MKSKEIATTRAAFVDPDGLVQEVAMRHVLTDEEWDQLQPLLPSEEPRRGRPWVSRRLVISGIYWLLVSGVAWRDLPEEFGKWKTVFNPFRRWVREGVWDDVLLTFDRQPDAEGLIDREQWNVDGTNVVSVRSFSWLIGSGIWHRRGLAVRAPHD